MNRVLAEFRYQIRFGLPVWLCLILTSWLPESGPSTRLRGALVAFFLPGRPRRLALGRDVTLLSLNKLKVGDRVYIAKGCWLNAIGGITLEDEVVLAPYVVMSSNNHGFKDGSVQRGGAIPEPISVGFGSWLAGHSVVAAGVNVGRGNVIAANSVVTSDTEDNVVMAGVPARKVKDRIDNPSEIMSKHDVRVEA